MNYLTPESEQQEYIAKCKAASLELLKEKSEQSEPTPMPYYPRQEP